jgi:CubicO group peptidase (beta-lactamase class C family)
MTMSFESAAAPPASTASTGVSTPSAGQGANRLWIVTAGDGRRFGPAARTDLLVWWEEGRLLPEMTVHDAETGEPATVADALRLPLMLEDRQVHTYIHPHEAEMGFLRTVRLDPHRFPEVIKVPGGLFPPGQTRIKYRINAGPRSADGKRRANLVLFISIHPSPAR